MQGTRPDPMAFPKRRRESSKVRRCRRGRFPPGRRRSTREREVAERPKRRVKGRGDPTLSDRSIAAQPAARRKPKARMKRTEEEKPLKTARGTSMGGRATARERAGAGLMPVAGLDVTLEDAEAFPQGAVTATVQALSELIEKGRPGIPRQDLGAASPAAPGEERGRRSAPHRLASSSRRATSRGRSRSWCRGSGTPASARRCCSASPAPARPSRWRRSSRRRSARR